MRVPGGVSGSPQRPHGPTGRFPLRGRRPLLKKFLFSPRQLPPDVGRIVVRGNGAPRRDRTRLDQRRGAAGRGAAPKDRPVDNHRFTKCQTGLNWKEFKSHLIPPPSTVPGAPNPVQPGPGHCQGPGQPQLLWEFQPRASPGPDSSQFGPLTLLQC